MLLKFAGIEQRCYQGTEWAKFVDKQGNVYYLQTLEFNEKLNSSISFCYSILEFAEIDVVTRTGSYGNVITFRRPKKKGVKDQFFKWLYNGDYLRKTAKGNWSTYDVETNTYTVKRNLVTPLKDFNATLYFVGFKRCTYKTYVIYEMPKSEASTVFPELELNKGVLSLQFIMSEEEFKRLAKKGYYVGALYGGWTFKSTPAHQLLMLKDK